MSSIVMVSGGFDPLHVGHARLILGASRYGAVCVALNSDAWLIRKKGYMLMPWEERAEILLMMQHVSRVVAVDDADGTVCVALAALRPDCFANGGDRTAANQFEAAACRVLGIQQLFGIGGGKVQSSSNLIERIRR